MPDLHALAVEALGHAWKIGMVAAFGWLLAGAWRDFTRRRFR
jgi:hypothetical protein